MLNVFVIAKITARGGLRNRLFLAVFFMGCLVVVGLQVLAGFSMRQPYQAAMAYNLAAINIIGVLLTLFLGVNLVCRDVDSRVLQPILAQPISRATYIVGQFVGLFALISTIVLTLALCGAAGLFLVEFFHPNFASISWGKYWLAVCTQLLGLPLLGALTIFFTSIATSTILPFLLSCAVYVIGLSVRATKDFLDTPYGQQNFAPFVKKFITVVYYVMPNFSFFNINQCAVYDLPVPWSSLGYYVVYWLLYSTLLVSASVLLFRQRDL